MQGKPSHYRAAAVLALGLLALGGCASQPGDTGAQSDFAPLSPAPGGDLVQATGPAQPSINLTMSGQAVRGTAEVEIIDTTKFPVQIQVREPYSGDVHRMKEFLPTHKSPKGLAAGAPNNLPVGGVMDAPRTNGGPLFPGISQTPWTPPDPTMAAGPNHVISTVNMAIAFYKKDGTLQFSSNLDSTGNPGFFETVGGGNFTFDPKCFYDHGTNRFVVTAAEYYGGPQQAFICIAVSDDSDPNGVWYKYRTNAKIQVGNNTYWVDYPGLGFDGSCIYVTGNLFGLNNGGTAGALYRTFNKAPLLVGGAATFTDIRDSGSWSVQAGLHHGAPLAPFFVSTNNNSSMKIQAIKDPLGTPSLVSTTVAVPAFNGPGSAPNSGGSLTLIDARIFNVHWRNGELYATHGINASGRNMARWYHFKTNSWPNSGSPNLVESGNIDLGAGVHTFFPAIYSNKFNDVGIVFGSSTSSTKPDIKVAGRKASDPPGTMGAPTQLKIGNSGASGRWGDYFSICTDPNDDATFWVIGEHQEPTGWATWIGSFTITTSTCAADCNTDGTLDIDDFICFQTYFSIGHINADCDKNGILDIDDFICYQTLFGIGCP